MLDAPFAGFSDPEDFAYGVPDVAALRLRVSIFADSGWLRDEMREDAESAGLRVAGASALARLLEQEALPLGDVVLLDCPQVNGETLAALARLDLRAGRSGMALVVSTSVEALDDVFACLDQSSPRILVAPGRAERLVALAQVMAGMQGRRVRELSEEDRMVLLRLTRQVTEIGERLNTLIPGVEPAASTGSGVFRFGGEAGERRATECPALPEPQKVRCIIRQRQLRARFFDADLFADPAWDMLLDLTAAHGEKSRVSVTSLCIASNVPPTTALRWISQMIEIGLLKRMEDETDRRRAFIALTDKAVAAMASYFAEMEKPAYRMA